MSHIAGDLPAIAIPDDFPKYGGVDGNPDRLVPTVMSTPEGWRSNGEQHIEPYERWCEMEQLANVFAGKCRRNELGKYSHLSRSEILARYLARVIKHRFGTGAECRWMIRRTAALLDWPTPTDALEPRTSDT